MQLGAVLQNVASISATHSPMHMSTALKRQRLHCLARQIRDSGDRIGIRTR